GHRDPARRRRLHARFAASQRGRALSRDVPHRLSPSRRSERPRLPRACARRRAVDQRRAAERSWHAHVPASARRDPRRGELPAEDCGLIDLACRMARMARTCALLLSVATLTTTPGCGGPTTLAMYGHTIVYEGNQDRATMSYDGRPIEVRYDPSVGAY